MSDTWRFDLTTSVWTPYSADPEAPSVASSMAIRSASSPLRVGPASSCLGLVGECRGTSRGVLW
eukprot:3479589-Rhodomonas_salina.3